MVVGCNCPAWAYIATEAERDEREQRIAELERDIAALGSELTLAELRIVAALEALKLPHPDRGYAAWANTGAAWVVRAHRARLALGAAQ